MSKNSSVEGTHVLPSTQIRSKEQEQNEQNQTLPFNQENQILTIDQNPAFFIPGPSQRAPIHWYSIQVQCAARPTPWTQFSVRPSGNEQAPGVGPSQTEMGKPNYPRIEARTAKRAQEIRDRQPNLGLGKGRIPTRCTRCPASCRFRSHSTMVAVSNQGILCMCRRPTDLN